MIDDSGDKSLNDCSLNYYERGIFHQHGSPISYFKAWLVVSRNVGVRNGGQIDAPFYFSMAGLA